MRWDKESIEEIAKKSSDGKLIIRGLGAGGKLSGLDELMIKPSQLQRMPRDYFLERIDTKVTIGEKLPKSLSLETPIFLSAEQFGLLSINARKSLIFGASLQGALINVGNYLSAEERALCKEFEAKLVIQWGKKRFGVNAEVLNDVNGIELSIGDGAKGSLGQILPKEKVGEEIASIERVEEGTTLIEPSRHLDIEGKGDLKKIIQLLREVTDFTVPIIIRLCSADVYDDVKTAVEAGADAVLIEGAEAGAITSPEILLRHLGIPTIGLFAPALRAFKETDAKDKGVKLLISGNFRDGADVFKALALGADAVEMSVASLIALGCELCMNCHDNKCEQGIATSDPFLSNRLDWRVGGERVSNFIRATNEELKMLTALTGHERIDEITKDDIVALSYDAASVSGARLIGYDRELPMWEHY